MVLLIILIISQGSNGVVLWNSWKVGDLWLIYTVTTTMTTLKERFLLQISQCIHEFSTTMLTYHFSLHIKIYATCAYINNAEKEGVLQKNDKYSRKKVLRGSEKDEDKKNAKEIEEIIIIATYDFQVILPVPRGDALYYKSKINNATTYCH